MCSYQSISAKDSWNESPWWKHYEAGHTACLAGEYAKAEESFKLSLAEINSALAAHQPEAEGFFVPLRYSLAAAYINQQKCDSAEPILKGLLDTPQAHNPKVLNDLAYVYNQSKQYGPAEATYLQALSMIEKEGLNTPPAGGSPLNYSVSEEFARCVCGLIAIYELESTNKKVQLIHKRALAIYSKSMGPNSPPLAKWLPTTIYYLQSPGRQAEVNRLKDVSKVIESL